MNRQLSRKLVALWTSSHPEALSLLQRVLPAGLLGFLDSSETVPANADDELGEGVPNRDNLKVQLIVNVPFHLDCLTGLMITDSYGSIWLQV